MEATLTREKLDEVLANPSISFPRRFSRTLDVYQDVRGSLLSLYPEYDIVKIIRECYGYYGEPGLELDEEGGLGDPGWYRIVSDKEFWNSVWRNRRK